jgi:antibiotic biosynthesis monooxygenase (ABM) superfamily enzyme
MNPSSPEMPGSSMKVRGASSVIMHRAPPDRIERFFELQRGITKAAATFSGYQGTDVYPPADRQQAEWVVVIHFEGLPALQHWLDSPVRAEWVEKLRAEMGDFSLKSLPSGFGAWFADLDKRSEVALPPGWKMALTVLLMLYPTVMLLAIFVVPHVSTLGLAVSMLISNTLSVSILQWVVQPALDSLLGPWLSANEKRQRAYSIGGLVVILILLGGMAILFRLVTG